MNNNLNNNGLPPMKTIETSEFPAQPNLNQLPAIPLEQIDVKPIKTKPKKEKNPKNSKKKLTKKMVLIISIILFVVIVGLVVIIFITNNKKTNNKPEKDELITNIDTVDNSFYYNGFSFEQLSDYKYSIVNDILNVKKTDNTELYLFKSVSISFSKISQETFISQLELDGFEYNNIKSEKYGNQDIMTAEVENSEGYKAIAFVISSSLSDYSFYGIAGNKNLEYDYELINKIQKIIKSSQDTNFSIKSFTFSKEPIFLNTKISIQTVEKLNEEEVQIEQVETAVEDSNNAVQDQNTSQTNNGLSANSVTELDIMDNNEEDEYEYDDEYEYEDEEEYN